MCRTLLIWAVSDPPGGYSLGFHDNDALDWIITLGYLLAAAACLYAWRLEARAAHGRSSSTIIPRFWLVLGILLGLLGINKQLNFQTLLGDVGRNAAEEQGWFEHRRTIQKLFVLCAGIVGLGLIGGLTWWIRRNWRRYLLGVIGLALAGLYAALRAATFNHMVHEPGGPRHHPLSQEILEVTAILLIFIATGWVIRESFTRRPKLQSFERVVRIR
jgi:hypothetical protein